MGSLSRKIKRKGVAKRRKQTEKDMAQKINMFDRMPDECNACEKPFDKKSREHANTWNVVVKEEKSVVRLYCPDCWGMVKKLIEQIEEVNDN